MSIDQNDLNLQPGTSQDYSYQTWRNAVYESLIDANMHKDAQRWLTCETFNRVTWHSETTNHVLPEAAQYVMVCSEHPKQHPKVIQKHTCGLRYCPTCATRFSARFIARYVPHITHIANQPGNRRLRHIILTTPFSLEDPDIKERYKAHQRFVRDVMDEVQPDGWREKQGYLACDEFGETGFKLHTHILHYGRYIQKDKITTAMTRISGGECEINYVRGVAADADAIEKSIKETLKYCTKFWREDDNGERKMIDPYLMPLLAHVLKGQRRVRSYGVFYGINEELINELPGECETCGSSMVKVWRKDWQPFVETGFTWKEIESEVISGDLDLKPANKSILHDAHIGDKPPPKQSILPNFEANQYEME